MELSEEQLFAYNKWREGHNLFVTGPGGCGKTHLIRYIYETHLRHTVVCAMTGCAAVLLDCNAQTIHSWSGIRLGKDSKEVLLQRIQKQSHIKKRWKKVECLIIDEISMMPKTILETLDYLGRHLRKNINTPFGGIQVFFSGDFYQLPPVNDTEFCFESPLWNELFSKDCQVELKTIFRQKDVEFQQILDQVRRGTIDKRGEKTLRKFMNRPIQDGLEPTKLFPMKNRVERMNEVLFGNIKEKEETYPIVSWTNFNFYTENKKNIPPDILDKCKNLTDKQKEFEISTLIQANQITPLLLKKGTFVMCSQNLDLEEGICNGSQGVVSHFENGKPVIKFLNGVERVIPLQYFQSEEYPSIVVGQYPLVYAWAMTIHKIQGSTLDCAEIDIGNTIFTPGQSYVALSRVKTLNGLYLKNFSKQNICAHPKVVHFYHDLHKNKI